MGQENKLGLCGPWEVGKRVLGEEAFHPHPELAEYKGVVLENKQLPVLFRNWNENPVRCLLAIREFVEARVREGEKMRERQATWLGFRGGRDVRGRVEEFGGEDRGAESIPGRLTEE